MWFNKITLRSISEIKTNSYESSKKETFDLVELDQEAYWSWMVLLKDVSVYFEGIYKWVS